MQFCKCFLIFIFFIYCLNNSEYICTFKCITDVPMKKSIKYSEEERVMKVRKKKQITVDVNFIQIFENIRLYVMGLKSPLSSGFLFWLIHRTRLDNSIRVDSLTRKDYYAECGYNNQSYPVERTMKNIIKDLTDNRILIRISRGNYKMNPMIIWRSTEKKRFQTIKNLSDSGYELGPLNKELKVMDKSS